MGKLIRLELKKMKLRNWLISVFIANIIIGLWVVTSLPNEGVKSYVDAFYSIRSYVELTFFVMASVLMSKLFLDEYKNRTISVLFTYPVPRSRIMTAKLIVLCSFSYVAVIVSNGFVVGFFLLYDAQASMIAETLTWSMLTDETLRIVINGFSVMGLGLIPLSVGLLRKSVPATIISAMVLGLSYGSTHDESGSNWTLALVIASFSMAIGLLTAYFSIRRATREDMM